jgi:hypothetical protein
LWRSRGPPRRCEGGMKNAGTCPAKLTTPSRNAESVRRQTSQLVARRHPRADEGNSR